MSATLLKNSELQFGATTFFAKEHKGETCGSNGLPLTPNSIIIYGKAQKLKLFKHPNLCTYLDIIRGKHERTVIVSQYCGVPLSNYLNKEEFSFEDITKIAYQIFLALNYIHEKKIVHRSLSTENILVQEKNNIKLFNYGLFYMTDNGKLVSFPIIQLIYAAPEVYLDGPNGNLSNPKVDVWSAGIVLAELVLNKPLWQSLKVGQRIRKVLSLVQGNTSIFERIAREHNCYEKYLSVPDDLKQVIEDCLNIMPCDRPTVDTVLKNELFAHFKTVNQTNRSKICEPFEQFTIEELYHWWQLAGGDVLLELKKQGLIRSSPPILSLPQMVLIDGSILGQERNPATLYDSRIIQMPLEGLYQRFEHIPLNCYYPLIHSKSEILSKADDSSYNAEKLPLVIREKDPEHQFHRVILLRRLLHGYPYTRDLIIAESIKDIPPLLRGQIWAALLNVRGDYQQEYIKIDKETPTATDRQIEVDIPRCHQYNELLSSSEGHRKLKRILKAWIYKNSQYVYWQGLDSLTAPFLFLNFNDEGLLFDNDWRDNGLF
uniref:Protein kinase domain-containing protein n=2 Tax=Photinus pyralis TaxID=7054 RepID=A0A1Y1JXH6_PHOPY